MQEVGFKEAGEMLKTPVSTLRRWVLLLEEQGYAFNRDGKRRQLDWKDVGILREVKMGLQESPLEEAVRKALSEVVKDIESEPQSNRDGESIEVFDAEIGELKKNLFWHGQDQAVSTLLTAWTALKNTIRRE
ncbi:hypothetical protein GCM10010912_58610 [Paenibacillus albidus]|uniref:Uncharacterized protein n=1 Tax=Paenibacillus albidus TaxID=2041023 RepID=A0A917D238_9BACL|nr:hypothetical protein [Paenibacillus albidus]GGG06273.1 hypothetical protein GCM10010912_58610 [Paenibacillus albidus]